MEISGKKSIQTLVEDRSLHPYIKVIYIYKTQEYLIALCHKYRVNYEIKEKEFFDNNYSDKTKYKYKYAIAIVKNIPTISFEQLMKRKEPGVIVVIDHIHDPFNLGAILRTCAAAGVKGIIIPRSNQAPINHNAVLKASQGYSLKTNVVLVSNLHQTILSLKKNGYWVYATALDKKARNYSEVEYAENSVLIIGNEGRGVSEVLKKNSDYLVYIPMHEGIDSLNVSVATGVMLFEMIKKR